MRGTGAVQVVLGEGEPGILRFVLEAEGFQVVGQARGESELRDVLDATHPSVIVLDAGISATAANDARARASGAPLVVVWPNGVRASVAEERVDPTAVFQDLGGAVRRAAERATVNWDDVVALPESPPLAAGPPPLTVVTDGAATPERTRRGSRRLLIVVAAWTLALTASAAAAFVVPTTLGLFERRGTPHAPAAPAPDRSPAERRDADPAAPADGPTGTGRRCERPDRSNAPRAGTGQPGGRGCGAARGREDRPADQATGGGKAEGRPEHANGGDGGKGAAGSNAGGNGNGTATGQGDGDGNGGGNGGGGNGPG